MVKRTIQTNDANGTAIVTTLRRFQRIYQLHGFVFGGAAQGAGRKSIGHDIKCFCRRLYGARYFTHQVNDMAVVMHFFIVAYMHMISMAAQVVAGQIYQHYMLCIFFIVFG